ncbi:MAG: YggS family pyridoxal phosphate-dependent enzyme [Chloroflexota bacterium]|nr:YggS family pyridoxal phosphate-dependent enzyme [Chloroflexota bacterium]
MGINANVDHVRDRAARAAERAGRPPDDVTIIAITKGVPPERIAEALGAGITNVGENRVQEASEKTAYLSERGLHPVWHMVGHLQTNKAKTALDIFDIIHSVDSVRLAESISKRAQHPVPVLLQVNISGEETKSGFPVAAAAQAAWEIGRLPNIRVRGLMTIAPMMADPEEVRPVFRRLRELRDSLGLEHLSMGMSDDFEVAVEEGATLVRIGRAIFEERRR